ncbi:YaaR family protein [Borreliella valaisiana]|uniref:YaaR family protein n=1 Tax=Borreliella valaisiana TaxID=62088 RepID=UPI002ED482B1|nr:YaaR family protein [Borreliella valaisiana]
MKINNLIAGALNLNSKDYKKGGKKVFSDRYNVFSSVFEIESVKEDKHFILLENGEFNLDLIKNMLDGINEIGERLLSEPSRQNVIFYKKVISEFLSIIISSSVCLKEQKGGRLGDLKRPKYRIIKIINDKLDKLAYSVLQNQMTQIKLLDSIEEIQGLLVNLLM